MLCYKDLDAIISLAKEKMLWKEAINGRGEKVKSLWAACVPALGLYNEY